MQIKDDDGIRFPRLKHRLYAQKESHLCVAEVAPRPSLRVNNHFLEGDGYDRSPLEKVDYKLIEAQHFGKYPKNPIRKLVAIVTAKDQLGGEIIQSLVIEGQYPWKNWFEKVHEVVLSPDGSRVAAVVSIDGSQTIVINDQIWATRFNNLFHWLPRFSPSSRRLAVSVINSVGEVVVVVNDMSWNVLSCFFPRGYRGKLDGNINNDRIYDPMFGPDDTCAVVMPKNFPREWTVAVEGKLWPMAFPWVDGFWMTFSNDGHIAVPINLREWKLGDDNRRTVAIDGKKVWKNEFHFVDNLSFLPNGLVAACAYDYPDQKDTIVVNDEIFGWLEKESRLKYEIKRRGKKFTVIGYSYKGGHKIQRMKRTYRIR